MFNLPIFITSLPKTITNKDEFHVHTNAFWTAEFHLKKPRFGKVILRYQDRTVCEAWGVTAFSNAIDNIAHWVTRNYIPKEETTKCLADYAPANRIIVQTTLGEGVRPDQIKRSKSKRAPKKEKAPAPPKKRKAPSAAKQTAA